MPGPAATRMTELYRLDFLGNHTAVRSDKLNVHVMASGAQRRTGTPATISLPRCS